MVANNKRANINIENAEIAFRNFTGKEGAYNLAGHRSFCVILDPELAAILEQDGWNIRVLKPRDDQDDPKPYVNVAVRFDNFPPKIVMVTGRGQTTLDESTVNILDWAEIARVDLTLNPSYWNKNGGSGIKAYLKTMWVTIAEDPFESRYANTPDSADNSMCDGCLNVSGSCDQCPRHNGE